MLPLISVIVPVYNVEDYLDACVRSITAQTYTRLEIILVDDGSTDSSGDICDSFAASDRRISVIHTANGGQSEARNKGIDMAKGDYICFVDSDDTISPLYVATLYELLCHNDASISMATLDRFSNRRQQSFAPNTLIKSGIEATEMMLYQSLLDSSPDCKLFKKSIFSTNRFKTGVIYEDLELLSRILPGIDKVVWCKTPLYYYTKRQDSTTGKFSLKRLDVLDVTDRIVLNAEKHYPELLPAAHDRKLSANFNMFVLLIRNGYAHSEHTERCWLNIKALRMKSLFNRHVRLKNKLGIIASLPGRRFLSVILRIFNKS